MFGNLETELSSLTLTSVLEICFGSRFKMSRLVRNDLRIKTHMAQTINNW